jgi:acetaldehyde dehydrogenase (acetylating)
MLQIKYRVAILGSGNIGTDLLIKVQRSNKLECIAFIGRNLNSQGMSTALELGVKLSDQSIQYIINHADEIDLVFDATSAKDHSVHSKIFKNLGIKCIDLTPAKIGPMCVPSVNSNDCLNEANINMVSCGGQASIPIAVAIAKIHNNIEYIEVVSSIASKSAGPATRINLDEYIKTTETGLKHFSGAKKTKAILILNPAIPCINMITTILAKVENPNINALDIEVAKITAKVQSYVPGYELILGPLLENGRIVIMFKVRGLGDYLPKFAGNLDIINCAAIAMAEEYAEGANNV